jgi:hypothetical protein
MRLILRQQFASLEGDIECRPKKKRALVAPTSSVEIALVSDMPNCRF